MKKPLLILGLIFTLCANLVLAQSKMEVKDDADNMLMQVNDEGAAGSVTLPDLSGNPTTTTNKLWNNGGTLYFNGNAVGGFHNAYVKVSDQKPSGTNGGTFASGAWQTRDINTEDADPQNIASISSNQITLPAGTYRCMISCPALFVGHHKARLQDLTGSTTLLLGTSEHASEHPYYGANRSFIVGRFTLSQTSTLEIQHRGTITSNICGFGSKTDFGVNEVYTVAEFWREN